MGETVRRRFVDDAVLALLSENLSFPVGLGEIPEVVDLDDGERRYAVINGADGVGSAVGPPTSEASDFELEYDVRVCAGLELGKGGAQWGADEVVRVLYTTQPWGAPVFPMVIDKHAEMGRSPAGGFPAATLLDGEWQSTGSVRFTVTRSS